MNNRLIIKGIFLSIMFLMFTNIVNAETITYNICKNGCEYDNLNDVLTELEEQTQSDELDNDDIIINFTNAETYSNENRDKKFTIGYKNNNTNVNSVTINGNNSTLEYYKIEIGAKNIKVNDLNLTPYYNTKEEIQQYNNDFFSYLNDLSQNGSELGIACANAKIENVTSTIFFLQSINEICNTVINNSNFNYFMEDGKNELNINNSSLGFFFAGAGTSDIYNSTIYSIIFFGAENNLLMNIYNSKIELGSQLLNIDNETKAEINMYNPLFDKDFIYVKTSYVESQQIDIDYNNVISIADIYFNEDAKDSVNTMIYFDKTSKLKPNERIKLINLLNYYAEGKEIEYTIEDESIAKIENKELIGLKAGSTKVTVTTDDGHVVYNIDLTVESSNTGKITKTNSPINNFANSDFSADNLDSIIPLTNVEQTAKDQGTNIDVFLEVKDISNNVSNEDKAKINEKVSNKETLAMYLDVSLFKQIEGQEATKIEETNGNIKVSLKVPENLKNNNPSVIRKYYILRLHDGVVDKLETELNGDTLSFETDKFSTYALTYEDVDNPKTGDSIILYVSLFVISVLSLIIYRKAGNKS